jgi:hypothetical protein
VAICGFNKHNFSINQHFKKAGKIDLKMPIFNIQTVEWATNISN